MKDGSTLRIRLLMPEGDHQFVNITLAGVRSPRVASKPDETSEQYGEEVCSLDNHCNAVFMDSFARR